MQLQPGREESEQTYTLFVKGCKFLSKLLRVTAESRQVAREFYPVRLPCQYGGGPDGTQPHDGTFYFHPELDILWSSPGAQADQQFIPFLKDLREKDPKKVGLRNLAMRANDINMLHGLQKPRLSAEHHDTLVSVLSNLENMYYLSLENAGRVHLGYLGGIPDIKEYEVHRAKPIMPLTPSFTRLPSDPRPNIDYDLSKVFVGTFDPRSMIFHWRKLLQRWGVPERKGQTNHHFLLSQARNYMEHISSRESAEQWLESEHASWLRGQESFRKLIEKKGKTVPIESEEELDKATKTAVGFWLFPVTALGKYPKKDEDYQWNARCWKPKRVLDLREYRPQLCLANLP